MKLLGKRHKRDDRAEQGLEPAAAGALRDLREDGIALLRFADLWDDDLWTSMASDMETFVSEVGRHPGDRDAPAAKDDYLIRRYGGSRRVKAGEPPPTLALDSPWLRFGLSDALLSIVTAYRGEPVKLVDIDQWYTVPFGATHARIASQRWHRDPEENHVVKVFVYFSDVDEDAGPFEYVRGSPQSGRYGDLWPWSPGKNYVAEEKLSAKVPERDQLTLTGPRGTVFLCDTSGFHRGGFARTSPRVLSYHTFVSHGSGWERRFEVSPSENDDLPDQARQALA